MHDKFSINLKPFCDHCRFFDPKADVLYGDDKWIHCAINCNNSNLCYDLAGRIKKELKKTLFAALDPEAEASNNKSNDNR